MTLNIKELKEQLNYDPETGVFTWKINKKGLFAGSVAGDINVIGYRRIGFNCKRWLAHRLAWFYMTGEMPKNHIDHINLNRSDNRWCNLREATNAENMRNAGLRKDNTSGYKGVYWDKRISKWFASANFENKQHNLGYFTNPVDASKAFQSFAKENYGEFYKESSHG